MAISKMDLLRFKAGAHVPKEAMPPRPYRPAAENISAEKKAKLQEDLRLDLQARDGDRRKPDPE